MSQHQNMRRSLMGASLATGLFGVSGCGVFSSSGKASLPELPALAGNRVGVAWRANTNRAGYGFAPAFAANSVWIAGRDGVVNRLEAATGKPQWTINANSALVGGVGADGDISVVSTRNGQLLAFDSEGKRKWTHAIGTEAATLPSVGVGVVVVRTSDNKTYGIDSETGRRRWTFARQNAQVVIRQTASVAIDGATTFLGLPGGRMVAVSVQNGAVRWEVPVSNPKGSTEIERINDVLGSPLISGREVCAASYQGRLSCFDVSNGRPLWSKEWQAVGGIELDARNLYASDVRGFVTCMARANNGATLWTQEALKGRELTAPVQIGSAVLVGDHTGLIHALSVADGALVGRLATDGSAIVSAGVNAGGLAVFQTSAGAVLAVSAS